LLEQVRAGLEQSLSTLKQAKDEQKIVWIAAFELQRQFHLLDKVQHCKKRSKGLLCLLHKMAAVDSLDQQFRLKWPLQPIFLVRHLIMYHLESHSDSILDSSDSIEKPHQCVLRSLHNIAKQFPEQMHSAVLIAFAWKNWAGYTALPVSELAKQRMLCLNMYRIMLYVCKKLLWPDWYGSGFDLSCTIVWIWKGTWLQEHDAQRWLNLDKSFLPSVLQLASMLLPLQLLKKLFQKLLASMLLLLQLLLSLLNIPWRIEQQKASMGSKQEAMGSTQAPIGSRQKTVDSVINIAGSKQEAVPSKQGAVGSRQESMGSKRKTVGSKQIAVGSRVERKGNKQGAAGGGVDVVGSNPETVSSRQLLTSSKQKLVGSKQELVGNSVKAMASKQAPAAWLQVCQPALMVLL